jgi:hypothetical protein
MESNLVTAQQIGEARDRLLPEIVRTPLPRSEAQSEATGAAVWLKAENLHAWRIAFPTGVSLQDRCANDTSHRLLTDTCSPSIGAVEALL